MVSPIFISLLAMHVATYICTYTVKLDLEIANLRTVKYVCDHIMSKWDVKLIFVT